VAGSRSLARFRRWAFAALLLVAAAASPEVRAERIADIPNERDIVCLALNVYHEARNQPFEGQLAVAHVTLNRVEDSLGAASICDVVFRGRDFSWTSDPAKRRVKSVREVTAWETAQRVARMALEDRDADPVGGSTFFHATWVQPDWATAFVRVRQIGDHIFYARNKPSRVVAEGTGGQRAEVVAD
jgi:N-acetylmuramoyl-L-alanine amidase